MAAPRSPRRHGAESRIDDGLAAARARLADAAWAVERAGSTPHRRDQAALRDIPARWTLVDEFESNGRRYVVAKLDETPRSRIESLSAREKQVTSLVARGQSAKQVAYELRVSESTVRVLLSRVYAKLGVKRRAALVAAWQRASAPDRQ